MRCLRLKRGCLRVSDKLCWCDGVRLGRIKLMLGWIVVLTLPSFMKSSAEFAYSKSGIFFQRSEEVTDRAI